MYGMINVAIQKFAHEIYHINLLTENDTNSKSTLFKELTPYPDALTIKLLNELANGVDKPLPQILEEFGNYWLTYARNSSYAGVLESFALTPWELLESLDALHHRLGMVFNRLSPPSFWVIEKSEHSILLGYRSQRTGLEPFVVGLIHGIFAMFNAKCNIQLRDPQNNETARFYVTA